jgi:hypothetical protein
MQRTMTLITLPSVAGMSVKSGLFSVLMAYNAFTAAAVSG